MVECFKNLPRKGIKILIQDDKREKFMGTVSLIYRDILNYQNSLNMRGFAPASQVIDLGEAKYLVEFLKSGVYIENSRTSEKSKMLVGMYTLQNKMADLVALFGVSRASLYKYSYEVESSISLVFPDGLQELWVSRNYEKIRSSIDEYLNVNKGEVNYLSSLDLAFNFAKTTVKFDKRVPISLLQDVRLGRAMESYEENLIDLRNMNYYMDKVLSNNDTVELLHALKMCKEKGLYVSPKVLEILE